MDKNPPERGPAPWLSRRLLLLGGANLLLAGAVTSALVRIQVLDKNRHTADARLQLRADSVLAARRGDILDSRGQMMATSYLTERVIASPGVLQDADLRASLDMVAERTGIPRAGLERALPDRESLYSVLASDLDPEVVAPLREDIQNGRAGGLHIESQQRRRYPSHQLASHLLGFVDGQNTGRAGIESYYDERLRGRPGRVIADRDPLGRPIPVGRSIVTASQAGATVQLTIDRRVQLKTEAILRTALERYQSNSGSILIVDPRNGSILAMANRPDFDPDRLSDYTEIGPQFLNSAVQLVWEPGSTFKLITMAAALDAGVIEPTTRHDFPGQITYGGLEISNWDGKTYPDQDMTSVLRHSSNTGAVWVANQLGPERFYEYLRAFGIGQISGVDLAGEVGGIVRMVGQSGWYQGDLAANSFGQGLAITPMQVAMAMSAIANGGKLFRPRAVRSVIEPDGLAEFTQPEVLRQVIQPSTAARLVAMMYSAERSIAGNTAVSLRYDTVGKTATTEVPISSGYSKDTTIPSYVGFGPMRAPQALVVVKIDAPGQGRWAYEVASPVFNEVVEAVFPLLGIPAETN